MGSSSVLVAVVVVALMALVARLLILKKRQDKIKDAIADGTCSVYDRAQSGGAQRGFFIELEEGGCLDVSSEGRVTISYQLEELEMKQLAVLSLRQQLDRTDKERSQLSRELQRAEYAVVELLKKGRHDE